MAVVENLEDMWVLSKLQRDRKAKEEAEKQNRLQVSKQASERTSRQASEQASIMPCPCLVFRGKGAGGTRRLQSHGIGL